MAANRTTFEKLQRDRAKKAKAAAKREKRLARSQGLEEPEAETELVDVTPVDTSEPLSAEELMKLVEKVHADYDSGSLTFEEFEEKKLELMERLTVE
jgi:hypothetical protein